MNDVDPPLLAAREAVARALAEDLLPDGDITASLLDAGTGGRLAIVARQEGVLAGRLCAIESFAQVEPTITVDWHLPDGSAVRPGDTIATVEGRLAPLLSAERTALNFLKHLSGVATLTSRFVALAAGRITVLDTRKTTPGLRALEKAAVRAGGGRNHRGNLSEGVLVKDNHLGGIGITEAVRRAKDRWPGRMVEVECDTLDQVREAAAAGPTMILLDNMTPDEIRACVAEVAGRCLTEVSGNVSLDTIDAYAATGADYVSVGALTHSAPVLDIGLDLAAGTQ